MVFPEALGRHVRTSLFPRLGIISLQLKCIRYVVHGRESGGAVFPGALGLVVRSPLVPYRGLGVVSLKSKMLAMLWAVSRVWGWPFPRIFP